jgi:hypothetical protein
MTNPTYSLGLTGTKSHTSFTVKSLSIPDSSASGMALNTFQAMAGVMQDGDQLLCKGPDGALRWYTIDAERSTPNNIILLAVR